MELQNFDKMGKLEDLEEELYGRDETKLEKRIKGGSLLRRARNVLPTSWREKEQKKSAAQKVSDLWATQFFWLALIFIFIVGGAVFVFFYLSTRGQEATIAIHGNERIEAGKLITLSTSFKNTSRTALREVELSVVLPEGSRVREDNIESESPSRIIREIKDLAPGEEGLVEIRVRIFGREGEEKTVQSALLYRPENLRARFSVRTEKAFLISHVPLATTWEITEILSRGQEAEFKVRYISNADIPFDNMYIKLEYPPGFTFKESVPQEQVEEGIWALGTLDPGESGFISVKGIITGDEGEIKSFRAGVGTFNEITRQWSAYSEASGETKIAVTPLFISASLERHSGEFINPGESLFFMVRYRNNTSSTIRNVTLRTFLEMGPELDSSSGFLDFSSLSIDGKGVFSALDRAVVWGPANVAELRELAPGKEESLSFNIQTKERPPVRRDSDKNLIVRLRSRIDAAGIPPELEGINLTSEDKVEYKVRSRILFGARAIYGSSPITNSGPLPPKVGEKTTYTIVWEIRNFTNDLRDVEVKATLPPNIQWENVVSGQDTKISFDLSSGEIKWRIGDVKAATGVLTPALTSAFQVSVVPTEADLGNEINLLNKSELFATDIFTGEKRVEENRELTTELRDDPTSQGNDWRVVR